jgi:hypothetical protein
MQKHADVVVDRFKVNKNQVIKMIFFVYVINSSNRRYGRNLAEEKPYSQMML